MHPFKASSTRGLEEQVNHELSRCPTGLLRKALLSRMPSGASSEVSGGSPRGIRGAFWGDSTYRLAGVLQKTHLQRDLSTSGRNALSICHTLFFPDPVFFGGGNSRRRTSPRIDLPDVSRLAMQFHLCGCVWELRHSA